MKNSEGNENPSRREAAQGLSLRTEMLLASQRRKLTLRRGVGKRTTTRGGGYVHTASAL